MNTIVAMVLSATLASGVVRADDAMPASAAPASAPAAPEKARRKNLAKDWWLWTLVAVFSAGTVVTAVVVASMPGGSLNPSPPPGPETLALTFRF